MLIDEKEGSLAGGLYLVDYDEDAWFALPAETQCHCWDTWLKKAKPLGARFLVLRLNPDTLFPTRGNETPYIYQREPIEQAPECGFVVKAQVSFRVTGEYSPIMRADISRVLETYPKGTTFDIWDDETRLSIETGGVK